MFEVEYTTARGNLEVDKVDANVIRDTGDGKWVDLLKFSEFVRRLPAAQVHGVKVIPDEKK